VIIIHVLRDCVVTVQSQMFGAVTFSSIISHTLPESKTQFFQVDPIGIRPVHSLKVFQLSSDVNYRPIPQ